WVFNGTAQRHGRTAVPTEHHAAYLVELSKAWADTPHRPVWLQEVGAPAPLIPPEHAAAFTEATVAGALDCPDLWGITWWCSHDKDPLSVRGRTGVLTPGPLLRTPPGGASS